jgi:hypothetical protein
MSVTPNVYAKARSEIIALFGWNTDSLSPEQSLRLDCAVALRLALDDLQGRIVRGESIDVNRMLTAAEALAKLLPAAVLASPPEANAPDPRQIMLDTYMGMRRRGELFDSASTFEGRGRRIAELEAEVAALKAGGAAPGDHSGTSGDGPATSAPADNVVSLRDNPDRRAAPAPAASPTVTNVTVAAPPSAPAYDYNANQDWKGYVNPDGSIRSTPRGRWDT